MPFAKAISTNRNASIPLIEISTALPVVCGPLVPVLLTRLLCSGERYPEVIIIGPVSSRISCNLSMNNAISGVMSGKVPVPLHFSSSRVKFDQRHTIEGRSVDRNDDNIKSPF